MIIVHSFLTLQLGGVFLPKRQARIYAVVKVMDHILLRSDGYDPELAAFPLFNNDCRSYANQPGYSIQLVGEVN